MARCVDRLDERVKQSFLIVGSPQIGPPVQVTRTLILLREVRNQLADGASFRMMSQHCATSREVSVRGIH